MSKTIESQDLESAAAKVFRRITTEPAHRAVLYKILDFCRTERSTAEIDEQVLSYPEMRLAVYSPQVLLSWLVQAGGIEVMEDEKGAQAFVTTQAGKNVVRLENPVSLLERLIAQDPAYHDIYLQVLQTCLTPKSKADIETLLDGNPILENPKVYPSYVIGKLEESGGLEWDGKWRTTQPGREFCNEGVVWK